MTRPLPLTLGLLGIATLLGLGWLLMGPGGAESPEGPGPFPAVPRIEAPAPAIEEGGSAPLSVATIPFADEDHEPPLAPELAAAMHFALVLDQEGRPASGVTVQLTDRDRGGFPGMPRAPNVLRTLKTGPDGSALLTPLPRRSFVVEARTATTFGHAIFGDARGEDPEEPPPGYSLLIRLRPIRRAVVQVADATRSPVPHIDVSLGATEVDDGGDRMRNVLGRGGRGGIVFATTGEDGRAVLEVTTRQGELHEEPGGTLTAHLRGLPAVILPVAWPAQGDLEAQILIPATVALTLEVRDPKDRLVPEATRLSWSLEVPETDREAGPAAFFQRGTRGFREVVGGRITLGGFAPNLQASFEAQTSGRLAARTRVDIPAVTPEAPIPIRVGEIPPVLSFRLLDETGAVLARERFSVAVEEARGEAAPPGRRGGPWTERQGRMRQSTVRSTDSEGRCVIPGPIGSGANLVISPPGDGFGGDLEFRRMRGEGSAGPTPEGPGFGGPGALLEIPLPALLPESTHDLGDLCLPPGSLALSGRVIGPDGKPLANASVQAEAVPPPAEEATRRRAFPPAPTSALSGADGRFRIFGRTESGQYRVRATAEGAESERQTVAHGTRDLDIHLERHAQIQGRLVWAKGHPVPRLEIQARRSGDEEPGTTARVREDGSFRIRGLRPGSYVLEARALGTIAAVLPAFHVGGGETATPPLDPWVVGADWQFCEVFVMDTARGPVAGARVRLEYTDEDPAAGPAGPGRGGRGRGRTRENTLTTRSDGRAQTWIRTTTPITVTVTKEGFETWRREGAALPLDVVLQAAKPLVLALPMALPESGLSERASAILVATDSAPDLRQLFRPDGRGGMARAAPGSRELHFSAAPPPGRYQILLLSFGGVDRVRGGRGQGERPQGPGFARHLLGEIEIPPDFQGGTLALQVDARTFAERLATPLP
jgi:hypothetical protein